MMLKRGGMEGVPTQTHTNQPAGGHHGANGSIHQRPRPTTSHMGSPGSTPPDGPLPTSPQVGQNQPTNPASPTAKERAMTRALPTPPTAKPKPAAPQNGEVSPGSTPPQNRVQTAYHVKQAPDHNLPKRAVSAMVSSPNSPQPQQRGPQTGGTQQTTTPTTPAPPSTPGIRQAKVLRDYFPQGPGQLSLKTGDVITVLSQNPSGLWAGSNAGKVGEFPSTHVELLPLTSPDLESRPVPGGGNVITGVIPRTNTPRASVEPTAPPSEPLTSEPVVAVKEEPPASDSEKMARMRQQVISELIKTEEDYLRDLDRIIIIFLFPLKTTAIVPESTIQTIFSNVEIIQNVNKEFYQNLENRMKRHSEINATIPVGDLFKKMGDYFKMYTTYCANHPIAVNTLVKLEETNPDFKNFLKICHTDKAVEGYRVYDYLIKPVQRICKYPLLIRELLKFTDQAHEDYPLLVDAQKKIDEVVDYINEAKRNAEGNQIVVDIQIQTEGSAIVTPTRHLNKEGVLMLHEKNTLGRTKPQKVIVFLFNDLLLVVRPKNKKYFEKDKRQKNCFTQKACIRLGTARLIGISKDTVEKESGKETVENCFEIQFTDADEGQPGNTASVVLSAASPEEERMWTKDIKSLIKEYQKKKYFEAQKAKAEAMLMAEQGKGPIQRSTSAFIDTGNVSPRKTLQRMQSEPAMDVKGHQTGGGENNNNNFSNNSSGDSAATTPATQQPAPSQPSTWSFSGSATTRAGMRRVGMMGHRSASNDLIQTTQNN